ncbi:hypothetical protein Sjap_021502 [Stephania japonica]|uniref:F-box domain-containing protein n=1 Tax=Stephania japonica TaxID=461633 RepID=A0AAP0EPP4_9MAGN
MARDVPQKMNKDEEEKAVEDSMCESVIIGILSRLPAESVLRFKSVCKVWRTLIEEPFFIEKHFEQVQRGANTKPNSIMFVNHNDGRLYSLDIESLSLSCDECPKKTYSPVIDPPKDMQFVHTTATGFGYDAKVKDYKLVRITSLSSFHDELQQEVSEVKVLTLGTNTWRELYHVPYNVGSAPGKLINGALHWIDVYRNQLICFNIEEEEVKEMAKPVYMTNNKVRNIRVFELGGCLALVCRSTKKGSDIEVWVMKEYGLENSWTKMFSIDLKRLPCSAHEFHLSEVQVLTVGTNAWRRLPSVPYHVVNDRYYDSAVAGKLVNGAIHWIDNSRKVVFCFDIEKKSSKKCAATRLLMKWVMFKLPN